MAPLWSIAFFGLAVVLVRGQAHNCADGSQPLLWEGTISDGSDDIELGTGMNAVSTSGDSIKLGFVEDMEKQVVFLRFDKIEVPPGADIRGAKVIYTVQQAGAEHSGDFQVVVFALRMSKFFPADRSFHSFGNLLGEGTTAANVTYVPDTTSAEAESESADLKAIVQEYVKYQAFRIGNAITLVFGTETAASTTQSRTYYSFESGGVAKAPRLSITYCLSAGSKSEASMPADMDSVQTSQKGSVFDIFHIFGAAEVHGKTYGNEGLRFQQWHTVPTSCLTLVCLVAVGMLVKFASRRYCSTSVDMYRQSRSRDDWEDDANEACIE